MKFPFFHHRRHVRFPKDTPMSVDIIYDVPIRLRPSIQNRLASSTSIYKPRQYCGPRQPPILTPYRAGAEMSGPFPRTHQDVPETPRRLPMLPPVVLLRIGDFLPDGSLANLACTNRRLQEWLTPSLYDRLIITIHPQLANPADPRDYLLLQAVCNGSLQATRFYLSLGANPNTVDSSSQSWSLLQNAIVAEPVWRAVELVRLLLRAGADMGFVAGDGMLAVHVAAQRGGVEVLRVVLKEMRKRGLGVGTRSFGEAGTAVHFAAGAGRLQALRMLISEWGADPREKDQDGEAPLIWAGRTGERECLEFLRRQLGVEAEEEKSQSRAGNWVGIADVIPNKSCLKRPKGKKEKKERW